jgi:hypothetical protein
MKWDNPQKKIPAPLPRKKKNNARPRGDPHERIPYKTSIYSSSLIKKMIYLSAGLYWTQVTITSRASGVGSR